MGDKIRISVEKVASTATEINSINNQMKEEFSTVRTAINKLDGKWNGQASAAILEKFHSIDDAFTERRYKVVNNYVNFLNEEIGVGYTSTEETNKSLAELFK